MVVYSLVRISMVFLKQHVGFHVLCLQRMLHVVLTDVSLDKSLVRSRCGSQQHPQGLLTRALHSMDIDSVSVDTKELNKKVCCFGEWTVNLF